MMKILNIGFVALTYILFTVYISFAQTPTDSADFDNNLTLTRVLDYALLHHPKIEKLEAKWKVQIERYRIQTGYPDPMINVTYFAEPIETKLGPQDYNISVSQVIPFPGKLFRKGAVTKKKSTIAKYMVDQATSEIESQVIQTYAELLYIQKAKAIAKENMTLLGVFAVQSQQSFAQDKGLLMDIMRADSQKGQLSYDLLLLEQIEKAQKARLNELLNRGPLAPIGQATDLAIKEILYTVDGVHELALENNDRIKISNAQLDKADAALDLAEYSVLPDFKIGLSYAAIGEPDKEIDDSGKDAIGIQMGMTIPLWLGKNNSVKKAALSEKNAANAQKRETQNQMMTKVSQLYFKLENAYRLIELYKNDLIPQAARALTTNELWYEEKSGSFSDLIEAQSVIYNFQLSLARASSDYIKVLAKLENIAGQSLVIKKDENEIITTSNSSHYLEIENNQQPDTAVDIHKNKPEFALGKEIQFKFIPNEQKLIADYQYTKDNPKESLHILSGTYGLDEVISMILVRNSGIQAGISKVTSAQQAYTQVNELDDVLTRFSAFSEGIVNGVGPVKGNRMIKSKFPFPGVYQLKTRVVDSDVKIALLNLEIQKRESITAGRKIFWDMVLNYKSRMITDQVIAQFEHLRQVASRRYQSGKTSFYDVVGIDIRLEKLKENLITLTMEQKKLEAQLLSLINLPVNAEMGRPLWKDTSEKLPVFENLLSIALKNRQELNRIRANIERMTDMVQMAESMILPDYSLGFSNYEDQAVLQAGDGSKPNFKETTMASKGYGSPVKPFNGLQNAWLAQTRKDIIAMKQTLKQKEFEIHSKVMSAWVDLDRSIRERDLYKHSILSLSKSALDVAFKEYEAGSLSFSSVIESYTGWLSTNLALAAKETTVGKSSAQIEKVIGLFDISAQVSTSKKQE